MGGVQWVSSGRPHGRWGEVQQRLRLLLRLARYAAGEHARHTFIANSSQPCAWVALTGAWGLRMGAGLLFQHSTGNSHKSAHFMHTGIATQTQQIDKLIMPLLGFPCLGLD